MTPSSHDQSSIQTWVSKYHSPIKGPGLLGEVFGSRSGAGKIQEAQNICGARKLRKCSGKGRPAERALWPPGGTVNGQAWAVRAESDSLGLCPMEQKGTAFSYRRISVTTYKSKEGNRISPLGKYHSNS